MTIVVDRHRFATVCQSQAIAMRVLAAVFQGRVANVRKLRGFGIQLYAGARADEHLAAIFSDDDWPPQAWPAGDHDQVSSSGE